MAMGYYNQKTRGLIMEKLSETIAKKIVKLIKKTVDDESIDREQLLEIQKGLIVSLSGLYCTDYRHFKKKYDDEEQALKEFCHFIEKQTKSIKTIFLKIQDDEKKKSSIDR